jgi:ABC-type Zn2+ transport system substrate-binding protein/surface adhesin
VDRGRCGKLDNSTGISRTRTHLSPPQCHGQVGNTITHTHTHTHTHTQHTCTHTYTHTHTHTTHNTHTTHTQHSARHRKSTHTWQDLAARRARRLKRRFALAVHHAALRFELRKKKATLLRTIQIPVGKPVSALRRRLEFVFAVQNLGPQTCTHGSSSISSLYK